MPEKTDLTIPMTQCPDPSAFVEISLSFERLGDEFEGGDVRYDFKYAAF